MASQLLRFSVVAALVAGCAPPPGAEAPLSPAARARPAPTLAPTAAFDAPLAAAGPDARRLDEASAALAARAEALRARAAGLGGPVVDPAARERLRQAVETGDN